jgi:hypothetical protein
MMKLDAGQTKFNDPEVAVWTGIIVGFCIAVAIIIADPKFWFLAFLSLFIFVPLFAILMYKSNSKMCSNSSRDLHSDEYSLYVEELPYLRHDGWMRSIGDRSI